MSAAAAATAPTAPAFLEVVGNSPKKHVVQWRLQEKKSELVSMPIATTVIHQCAVATTMGISADLAAVHSVRRLSGDEWSKSPQQRLIAYFDGGDSGAIRGYLALERYLPELEEKLKTLSFSEAIDSLGIANEYNGTSALILYQEGKNVHIASIGDSRAFLFRGGDDKTQFHLLNPTSDKSLGEAPLGISKISLDADDDNSYSLGDMILLTNHGFGEKVSDQLVQLALQKFRVEAICLQEQVVRLVKGAFAAGSIKATSATLIEL